MRSGLTVEGLSIEVNLRVTMRTLSCFTVGFIKPYKEHIIKHKSLVKICTDKVDGRTLKNFCSYQRIK